MESVAQGEGTGMKVWWKVGQCTVVFPGLDQPGLSCLRLLQYHLPNLNVEAWRSEKDPIHTSLREFDFGYESVYRLNTLRKETLEFPMPPGEGVDANGSPIR